MPKKTLHSGAVPTLIQERLQIWGLSLKKQRTLQRLRAADLCERMGISEATLRRLERGDAGAGASLYLIAFQILGILDEFAPVQDGSLWSADVKQRVRLPREKADDGYF